jgi:hypothetical protein
MVVEAEAEAEAGVVAVDVAEAEVVDSLLLTLPHLDAAVGKHAVGIYGRLTSHSANSSIGWVHHFTSDSFSRYQIELILGMEHGAWSWSYGIDGLHACLRSVQHAFTANADTAQRASQACSSESS